MMKIDSWLFFVFMLLFLFAGIVLGKNTVNNTNKNRKETFETPSGYHWEMHSGGEYDGILMLIPND